MSSSQRLIEAIHHYQSNLERYFKKNEEAKMLHCISRLNSLPIEVSHLEETGVGRTVNSMRKIDGSVGEAARGLVNKWKSMVSQLEEESNSEKKEPVEPYSSPKRSYEDDSENESRKRKKYDSSSDYEEEKPIKKHKDHKNRYNSESSEVESEPNNYNTEEKVKNGHREKEKLYDDSRNRKDARKDKERERRKESEREARKTLEREAKREAEREAKKEAEREARKEAEREARKEAEREAKIEAERVARKEAEREARKEAEREARKEAEREARKEAEREARKEAERKAKKEAEKEAKKETEREARKEAERQAKKEAEKEAKRKFEKEKQLRKETERESRKEKERESKKEAEREERRRKEKESKSSSRSKDDHKKESDKKSSSQRESSRKEDKNKKDDKNRSKKYKSDDEESSDDNRSQSSGEEVVDKNLLKSKDRKSGKYDSDESKSKNGKYKNAEKKSDKSSSSSTKTTSKIKLIDDCGIDSASGATFAEALGMTLPFPTSSKRKSSTVSTPEKSRQDKRVEPKLQEPVLLQNNFKLEPLDLNMSSLLPQISTNYKPLNNITDLDSYSKVLKPNAGFDDEALTKLMYAKNQRTKVYSGNKCHWGKIPTLFEICTRILQDNIDALEYTGGVPYAILKPVLEKATPDQLFMLEHHNPYLIEDTDELWCLHCQKEFRNKKREELESWREKYMRCLDEREAKLKALTANIKLSQDKSTPVRQTKLAYVDSVVKPPRNIARKQVKNGIVSKPAVTPSSRLSTLALADGADQVVVPNPSRGSSVNRKRDKKEGLLNQIPKEDIPLQTYHIDYLGPLECTNKNYKHILAVVDGFTKFVWLYPVKTTSSKDIIDKL